VFTGGSVETSGTAGAAEMVVVSAAKESGVQEAKSIAVIMIKNEKTRIFRPTFIASPPAILGRVVGQICNLSSDLVVFAAGKGLIKNLSYSGIRTNALSLCTASIIKDTACEGDDCKQSTCQKRDLA
jgi:hypothetical protein